MVGFFIPLEKRKNHELARTYVLSRRNCAFWLYAGVACLFFSTDAFAGRNIYRLGVPYSSDACECHWDGCSRRNRLDRACLGAVKVSDEEGVATGGRGGVRSSVHAR